MNYGLSLFALRTQVQVLNWGRLILMASNSNSQKLIGRDCLHVLSCVEGGKLSKVTGKVQSQQASIRVKGKANKIREL